MAERAAPLTAYHAHVPRYRLDRGEAAAALGEQARGRRAVAAYDEDTTSLAVEAARHVAATPVPSLWFATGAPAYVDKTNATAVHAALSLDTATAAYDLGASARSGAAALRAASSGGGLAVLADIRDGRTGSADERGGGDASAAFSFGPGAPLADVLGWASASAELLDRWRLPGDIGSSTWEERFAEGFYDELAKMAVADVLKQAGHTPVDVAAIAIAGPHQRAVRSVTKALAAGSGARVDTLDLLDLVGNAGAAHVGLVLADLLDRAEPGEMLLVVSVADGADALLLRATDALVEYRADRRSLRDRLGATLPVNYPTYLLWRGRVERDRPRRPDPVRPSAPFASRNVRFKYGFLGGRCRRCDVTQFPLPRVCVSCGSTEGFAEVSGAGRRGRIVTYTVDRLAFTPSPPLVSAVVDLESGGRVQLELTDVDPQRVTVGDEVELTFRRLLTVEGIHNYFWKARPAWRSTP